MTTSVAFPRSWPAITAYATYALMGVLYGPAGLHAKSVQAAGDRTTQYLWAWLLLISGALYVSSSMLRNLRAAFGGQSIAASGAAVGLAVYAISVALTNTAGAFAPACVLSGGLALASGIRSFVCWVDLRKVINA